MKITSIKLDSNTPGLYQGLVSTSTPSISWQCEGNEKEWMQYAYQIRIRYESGKFNTVEPVISANSNNIPWPDSPLKSGEEFEISVRVSDKKNATTFSDWSNPIKAQVGILAKDPWPAKFIAMEDQLKVEDQRPPETLFQKTFAISENIKSAKLFSTAAGVYEIEINGQKISDDFLKPGWTTYEKRILHQYYDVSDYIISGQNCIGGRVGAGWYSGHIGMDSINPGEMTSFNHFALGSVITFLHEIVAGISSLKPGYKEFKIRPQPGGGLKKCKLTHVFPYGEIVVEWEIIDNSFNLFVKVPLNTTAEMCCPMELKKWVLELTTLHVTSLI